MPPREKIHGRKQALILSLSMPPKHSPCWKLYHWTKSQIPTSKALKSPRQQYTSQWWRATRTRSSLVLTLVDSLTKWNAESPLFDAINSLWIQDCLFLKRFNLWTSKSSTTPERRMNAFDTQLCESQVLKNLNPCAITCCHTKLRVTQK